MFGTKINRTSVRSFQSVEASRNPRVSTKATEEAEKVVARKVSGKEVIAQIARVVCAMMDSKQFSGLGVEKCATIAVNKYQSH